MCGPIGYNEPLKAELAFEDLIKRAVVLACKGVVDEVWCEDTESIYARN